MNRRFQYPHKIRNDFLTDVVRPMIEQRIALELTQDDINHLLNVADRLVSKWECGARTPTSFNLYCWADALDGKLVFIPNNLQFPESKNIINKKDDHIANQNRKRKVSPS